MAKNDKKYRVGKSKIQGKGVFSKQDLTPGDYIGKAHTINKLYTDYDFTDLGKNHNHSDNPNVQNILIGNERHFVATKPIKKGEELTTDYRLQPDLEQPEDFEKAKNGGWLDAYDAPQAQNGIEGTMGGLTDKGFNFNPAWGGAWQNGGKKTIPLGPTEPIVDVDPIRYENREGIGEVGILPNIVIAPHLDDQGKRFYEKILDRPSKPEERYEPSDAVKYNKGALSTAALSTMAAPEIQYLIQLAGATGDFYTGTRYALDKNWSKAGEDYTQGLLGLIPYSKALKGMKGDEYYTLLQKLYNATIGGLKFGSDVKTMNEGIPKKQNGGMLQPPMAGAMQTLPIYQMGGSIPGSVGFTYAREAGAAPSEGPSAKKTLPSAQDGELLTFERKEPFRPTSVEGPSALLNMDYLKSFVPEYQRLTGVPNRANDMYDRMYTDLVHKKGVDPMQGAYITSFLQENYDPFGNLKRYRPTTPETDYTEEERMESRRREKEAAERNKKVAGKIGEDYFQNGGEEPSSLDLAKIKAKMALESHFGNPSARRMTTPYPQDLVFKLDAGPDKGKMGRGTHWMYNEGNYAVPIIQEGTDKKLFFNKNASPSDREAMRFDSPEEALMFAENYKEVAPMMRNSFQNGGMAYYQAGLDFKPKTISRDGSSVNKADEYPLEKLDNLLNFTNYNKPKAKSGGWLDKYN